MPPRGQKNTQEPTFVKAASTSARAARSPARRILFVIASPSVSIPFRSYIRPVLRRRSRRSPGPHRLMYARRFFLLNIRKAPAGEDGEPVPAGARSARIIPARGQAPTDSKRAGAMRDFGEHHQGEGLRIHLPRTRANKGKQKDRSFHAPALRARSLRLP
jgi:hypothetical protein